MGSRRKGCQHQGRLIASRQLRILRRRPISLAVMSAAASQRTVSTFARRARPRYLPAPWPRRCRSCRMRRSNSPIAPSLISAASAPSRADGPGQSDRVSRSAGCRGLHPCRTTEGSNVDRHIIGDQPARADQRIITGRKPFATPGRSVARARNLSGAGPPWPRCHRLQSAETGHSKDGDER